MVVNPKTLNGVVLAELFEASKSVCERSHFLENMYERLRQTKGLDFFDAALTTSVTRAALGHSPVQAGSLWGHDSIVARKLFRLMVERIDVCKRDDLMDVVADLLKKPLNEGSSVEKEAETAEVLAGEILNHHPDIAPKFADVRSLPLLSVQLRAGSKPSVYTP